VFPPILVDFKGYGEAIHTLTANTPSFDNLAVGNSMFASGKERHVRNRTSQTKSELDEDGVVTYQIPRYLGYELNNTTPMLIFLRREKKGAS
jgi:hypothetical protein